VVKKRSATRTNDTGTVWRGRAPLYKRFIFFVSQLFIASARLSESSLSHSIFLFVFVSVPFNYMSKQCGKCKRKFRTPVALHSIVPQRRLVPILSVPVAVSLAEFRGGGGRNSKARWYRNRRQRRGGKAGTRMKSNATSGGETYKCFARPMLRSNATLLRPMSVAPSQLPSGRPEDRCSG